MVVKMPLMISSSEVNIPPIPLAMSDMVGTDILILGGYNFTLDFAEQKQQQEVAWYLCPFQPIISLCK